MFDVFYIGKKPGVFAHERAVDSLEQAQRLSRTRFCWVITYLADYTDWDFLWEPPPWQRHFTHVWPSQWHEYSGTYLVPRVGPIEFHFQKSVIPNRSHDADFEMLTDGVDFDWTWAPHPLDPAYIYVFGNQWHRAEIMPTLEYHVPGATERKFMPQPLARLQERHDNHWNTLVDCEFDYSWRPDPGDPAYIYVFGNQWHRAEVMPTVEYHVPGATERKFMRYPKAQLLEDRSLWEIPEGIDASSVDFSWVPDPGSPSYIYEFGTQWQKTGGARYIMPGATERKFMPAPRCVKVSRDDNWEIPEDAVYDNDFDWTWHPDSTERPYIYQFGTQHQKTGGPVYRIPGATEVKYVDQIRVTVKAAAAPVYIIDHIDGNANSVREEIGSSVEVIKTVRYVDNYLDTLRRIAASVEHHVEYIWICSSVCDYTNFDFTWYPEQWQASMLHVFASDNEKFGDTFFMHVPTFLYRSETCQLLEWYDLHFVEDKSVPRRAMPVIRHSEDTHVAAVKTANIPGPLAVFVAGDREVNKVPPVPLWREKTKTVVPLTSSGDITVVPKVSVPYVQTQLYDYAWIDKTQKSFYPSQSQDIVFISYDEPQADENWQKLKSRFPRAIRVHGVAGMENALVAAAEASTTPWYFAVFAKTDLANEFEFDFVPDYLQQAKHYVFDCENTVNGLRYGHMGIVMYNCAMVQQGRDYDQELGLDYTLSFPHEVVPLLSCYGKFDSSPYHTWRTAFREASKLAYFNSVEPSIDGEYRLKIWTTHATGPYAEWCLRGAADGVEFFQESQSDLAYLKKGFRWEWLRKRFVDRWGDLD